VLSSRFFLTLTSYLSQILINSGIILKCHKLFEARHNIQNAKIAVGTMVIISTNFEKKNNFHRWNVPKRSRRNKNKGKEFRTKGWKNKKGIKEVTEDVILVFLDMKVRLQNFTEKLIHITTRILWRESKDCQKSLRWWDACIGWNSRS
jgi:hypothetical protein